MIYVGRIDNGKGCDILFSYFEQYKKEHPESDLKLVLIGKSVIPLPEDSNIISLGYLSEIDKFDAIMASDFLIMPSKYESLSIALLESFAVKKPVLVNGECEVLKAHCLKSGGGLYYLGYHDFCTNLMKLESDPDYREIMGKKGYAYVINNYQWDIIIAKLFNAIRYVAG